MFALVNVLLMDGDRSRDGSVGCFFVPVIIGNPASSGSGAFWLDSRQHTITINIIARLKSCRIDRTLAYICMGR